MKLRATMVVLAMLSVTLPALAHVSIPDNCALTHPMGDAWWTGPMLANTAETAPRGHYLLEPYLYDVSTQGTFAANGARNSTPHANNFGSLTYIVYGLADTWGVGVIPTGGYNQLTDSSSTGMGDWTVQAQHRLTHFVPCRRIPTVSLAVQQTLPTAKYDRLGNKPAAGLGAGAYTTNVAAYSQMYFWMPNRRIVRMRFNLSESFSSIAPIRDASVYSTSNGFRGEAKPGNVFFADTAWEYSVTRRWAAALDATYRHANDTLVSGDYVQDAGQPVLLHSGSSDAFGFAPAVEYNFNSRVGVLLGMRIIAIGRNTAETITPAIAINYVH
ncbi:MAG: transporter [Acidobacteriota bacterium]